MAYNITLSNGTELISGGLLDNTTDSVNSSLTLVGKNYKGYGLFINQNIVRLMENFADTTAPTAPIPGQLWFNSTTKLLNVNVAATKGTANAIWKTVAGMTLSASTPTNAYTGEQWYDTTNGQLKIYTGTEWRLIGPLSRTATGNSGAIPDTVTDAPPSTTFVVLKFFINNILVGIWSNDGPFASDVTGFATIRKGLNLNSTLGHTFWGNSEVASSLYVSGVAVAGSNFLRNDTSGTVNGALTLTNDGGITFGAASDFVGNVNAGVVTLKNQTNNKDLILSLKTGGAQTPFLRGNYITGLAEVYSHPVASSPALSVATKNYVDILSGSVNGTANFFGHITPSANLTYTLGNTTNRWTNVFSESILVGNLTAANTFATISNVAQIYLGADIIPTANISSNVGSSGMRFNTLHAVAASLTGSMSVGTTATVGGDLAVSGTGTITGNLSTVGNLSSTSNRTSTSTATGALVLSGGAGIGGNLHVGGTIVTPTMPAGTSNTAVATTAFVQNNSIPTGGLMMWSTDSAPTGYLLCNGTAVSRTTYAALFAVIGTTFGVGDNSTTFNLPNYTNRLPVGAGGLYALAATGGSKDSTVVSHTHTATSTVTDPTHRHLSPTGDEFASFGTSGSAVGPSGARTDGRGFTSNSSTGVTVATTVASAGSSGTDANMPPYLAINFIIKT
jgi:microcystin-dependent protein